MRNVSAKENFFIFNTLASVPVLLRGKAVLIDLLNETSVAGRIDDVDGYMNINLVEAVFIDRHGLQYEFDEITVKNRCIRQIQIPGDIDVGRKLQAMLENTGKREQKKTKRTFKQIRARNRHEEILQELVEKNKESEK